MSFIIAKVPNVVLRAKEIKNGFSLFLDMHINKKRKRETLFIHVKSIKNPSIQDKKQIDLAKRIMAKRNYEHQAKRFDEEDLVDKKVDLLGYIEDIIFEKSFGNPNSLKKWKSLLKHLTVFSKGKLYFVEIDPEWAEGFKKYLLKNMKRNSADRYFSVFKSVLNSAVVARILLANPLDKVKGIGKDKSLPRFLTIEEVEQLHNSDYPKSDIKLSFLFSCFTGLRFNNVKNLKWKNIVKRKDRLFLNFRQVKKGSEEYLPLSTQSITYLGDRGQKEDNVFKLVTNYHVNKNIQKWAKTAGLDKHITFHMARHTFATMSLTYGVDLYTVSKLLGHSDIKHTQIYAEVIDKKREEAIDLLPTIG